MVGYDFDIIYTPICDIVVANALSQISRFVTFKAKHSINHPIRIKESIDQSNMSNS